MKALLLLAGSLVVPTVAATADRVYEGEYSYETIEPIYEWVCNEFNELYEEFECPPQPVVVTAVMRSGLWGYYYRNSQLIWVADRLTLQPLSVFGEGIIAHEAVHYVLSMIDDLQPRVDSCRNEGLAWSLFNKYVMSYGFENLVNPDWWESYPRCDSADGDANANLVEWVLDEPPTVDETEAPSEAL